MESRSLYKSIFHILVLEPGSSGLSFEQFLYYLTNKDIKVLDLAISETILRVEYYKRLGSFYNYNIVTCNDEFKMIVSRGVSFEKFNGPVVFICKLLPLYLLFYLICINVCVILH